MARSAAADVDRYAGPDPAHGDPRLVVGARLLVQELPAQHQDAFPKTTRIDPVDDARIDVGHDRRDATIRVEHRLMVVEAVLVTPNPPSRPRRWGRPPRRSRRRQNAAWHRPLDAAAESRSAAQRVAQSAGSRRGVTFGCAACGTDGRITPRSHIARPDQRHHSSVRGATVS